jgi:hypothetical protein
MTKTSRLFPKLLALAFLLLTRAPDAHGATCGTTPSDCLRDHGGTNRSQVAVGPGLACAVAFPSSTSYGGVVECFTPVPGDAVLIQSTRQIFNQGMSFSSTVDAQRIHSIAIEGTANGIPGPVSLWALRKDGYLFVSQGDSALVNGSMTRFMSDFVAVAYPEDVNGNPISLKMITVAQPPYGGASVVGVTTQSLLYTFVPTSNRWRLITNTNYFIGYGGPYGLLAINGATGPAQQNMPVSILYRLPLPAGATPLPPLPVASKGMQIKGTGTPRDFDYFGRNQPISLGTQDAWFLSGGVGLYRSKLGTNGWSAWAQAAPYSAMSVNDSFPWSIADARSFRGRRGEIMLIGGPFRLRTYFTPTSSNN